jgi:hypothetical protein
VLAFLRGCWKHCSAIQCALQLDYQLNRDKESHLCIQYIYLPVQVYEVNKMSVYPTVAAPVLKLVTHPSVFRPFPLNLYR